MASETSTTNAASSQQEGYANIHPSILAAMAFVNTLQPTIIDPDTPSSEPPHCAICADPASWPIELPGCGHVFCKACLMAWLTPFDREAPEPLHVDFVVDDVPPHDGEQQILEAAVGQPELRSAAEEAEAEEDADDDEEAKDETLDTSSSSLPPDTQSASPFDFSEEAEEQLAALLAAEARRRAGRSRYARRRVPPPSRDQQEDAQQAQQHQHQHQLFSPAVAQYQSPYYTTGPNTCPLCRCCLFPAPDHGMPLLSLHLR
ncbi:MAG: hypothetical protein Q9174_003495, partial [Haloplaca sp. 1 TL-2023]